MGKKSEKARRKSADKAKEPEIVDAGTAGDVLETAVAERTLSAKDYARELKKLHVELVKLQEWVKREGQKVCIVLEGRDGAGKGGTIKAITERVSPGCSASWPCPRRRSARSRRCTHSATCLTSRRPARS
jgi:polyphosphate kinase 2 (PPK2 family)